MKTLVKVVEVFEKINHTYIDRSGQNKEMMSQSVLCSVGGDLLLVELLNNDVINAQDKLIPGDYIWVELHFSVRSYEKEGKISYIQGISGRSVAAF